MNFSWVDILFVAVLLFCMIQGMVRGFVKTVISFFLVVAAAVLAKIFSADTVAFIKTKTNIYANISQFITKKMSLVFSGNATSEAVTDSAQLHNIPDSLLKYLNNFISTSNNTVGTPAEAFGQNAAGIIVDILAFAVIFLAVIIIGRVLLMLLDKVMSLPVLKTFNHFGGLLLGLVKGVMYVVLIATVIYSLNVFLQVEGLSTAINNSMLIKYFYLSFLFT